MSMVYPITVRRSKRKTASIYIEQDGSLSVFVPDRFSDQDVETVIKGNEYRIFKYQAKRALLSEKAVTREPVNGQSYLYLGRNYCLQFSTDVKKIEFKGRYFYAPPVPPDKLRQLFKDLHRVRGKQYIPPPVMHYAELLLRSRVYTINELAVGASRFRT